jgi:hypothetical protein
VVNASVIDWKLLLIAEVRYCTDTQHHGLLETAMIRSKQLQLFKTP